MSYLIDISKYKIIHNKAFLQPAPISYFSWILQNAANMLCFATHSPIKYDAKTSVLWATLSHFRISSLTLAWIYSLYVVILQRRKRKVEKREGGRELDTPKKRASILSIDFDRTSSEWTNVGYKYYYVQKYFYYVVI